MNTFVLEGQEVLKRVVTTPNISKFIKTPFEEKDILYLQNAFTTPGVHAITVTSIETGRKLIDQLLDSLKWYQDVGYLASSDSAPCKGKSNVLHSITQPITPEAVAQFFIDDFYYDFLWIEATNSLLQEPWIAAFEQQLIMFHIDHMIPVIIVSYKE